MNNLSRVQEAIIGLVAFDCIPLDFGPVRMTFYYPSEFSPYCVLIDGDDLAYEFASFGEAMDFANAEAMLMQ